nr:hypothetical protein OG781_39760 [Streptomyces sp. NBC_00830]
MDLKQIQAGPAVSRDGGIPVFHRVYDGGAGEVAQVVGAMKALRKIADRKVRPTGRMILHHRDNLMLRPGTTTDPLTILISQGVQAHLLELLGIDETRPRWLET